MSVEIENAVDLIEVIDAEGFHIFLPCEKSAISDYWTSDKAPICYLRLSERGENAVNFKIKIGKKFSGFTEEQKLIAVGEVVSHLRPLDRISLTMSNFSKDEFDDLIQVYLRSKRE